MPRPLRSQLTARSLSDPNFHGFARIHYAVGYFLSLQCEYLILSLPFTHWLSWGSSTFLRSKDTPLLRYYLFSWLKLAIIQIFVALGKLSQLLEGATLIGCSIDSSSSTCLKLTSSLPAHTYAHTCMHAHIWVCAHMQTHTCMYTHTHKHTHILMHTATSSLAWVFLFSKKCSMFTQSETCFTHIFLFLIPPESIGHQFIQLSCIMLYLIP